MRFCFAIWCETIHNAMCRYRSLQQSFAMDVSHSPTPRSPSAVLMPSQPQTGAGRSTPQALHQSPARRSLQVPSGPWHCPSNVSPDHAAQLAQRLLSPNRPQPLRTQLSQEPWRHAQLSQRTGPLEIDAPGHLRVIPETQSMDESPLCAGTLEVLPTQTSGINAARATRGVSVVPRLQRIDAGPGEAEADAELHRRRSQSLVLSESASAKAARQSCSVATSPQAAEGHAACDAEARPRQRCTPAQHGGGGEAPASDGAGVACDRELAQRASQQGSAGQSVRERTMAGRRGVHSAARGTRKRRSRSGTTSGADTAAQPPEARSGDCQSAGHSTFRPPLCSQPPHPIIAAKAGKRRRITPTQISTGGAPWPPSAQAVLRQHRSIGGKQGTTGHGVSR